MVVKNFIITSIVATCIMGCKPVQKDESSTSSAIQAQDSGLEVQRLGAVAAHFENVKRRFFHIRDHLYFGYTKSNDGSTQEINDQSLMNLYDRYISEAYLYQEGWNQIRKYVDHSLEKVKNGEKQAFTEHSEELGQALFQQELRTDRMSDLSDRIEWNRDFIIRKLREIPKINALEQLPKMADIRVSTFASSRYSDVDEDFFVRVEELTQKVRKLGNDVGHHKSVLQTSVGFLSQYYREYLKSGHLKTLQIDLATLIADSIAIIQADQILEREISITNNMLNEFTTMAMQKRIYKMIEDFDKVMARCQERVLKVQNLPIDSAGDLAVELNRTCQRLEDTYVREKSLYDLKPNDYISRAGYNYGKLAKSKCVDPERTDINCTIAHHMYGIVPYRMKSVTHLKAFMKAWEMAIFEPLESHEATCFENFSLSIEKGFQSDCITEVPVRASQEDM